jgi:hypothetical protein
MHTGHKAVLNDETDWVRLENHHEAIVDRELFEKANAMHPRKSRGKGETRTNYVLERKKKRPALVICAHCGRGLFKESEHLLKCSGGRTSGDPICRNLVIRRETMEEHILALVHQFVSAMLEEQKTAQSNPQNVNPETDLAELSKQSRQLSSLKMKLYDDYKDGRIDREVYKQRAEKIGEQMEAIRQKTEELTRKPVLSEQKFEETEQILGELQALEKFDAEQLRKIIKVIRVHSQDEIEIEWNFDDLFWNRNKNLLDNPV